MKMFFTFFVLILFYTTISAQVIGQALLFDGIDNYVSFGNPIVFDVDTAVTYEAWIRPDTTSGFIFNKWVNFQEDKQMTYSGDKVTFYMHNVFSGVSLVSASSVPLHQYTHVAATYDGSTAKLYINGVLDTSKSVSSPVSNSNGIFYLAHNPDRFDVISPFKGIIDEFRIWNIARTESEIQSTMNQELNGNEPGLVGYWKFDEGQGLTTADATSNGDDGTINGAVWIPGITGVENENKLPETFSLSQNYPNPFNPSTTIKYSLPFSGFVTIKVYDVLGNEITTLVNEDEPSGNHSVQFNATSFSSGLYFYSLQSGNFIETKKMLLLK
jgi:Concanavalin A-like lectin/glucanases superfamily/Secretion system C-terminal sorting domain